MEKIRFNSDYNGNVKLLSDYLRMDRSFDLITRRITFAGRNASVFYVDGLCKDEVVEKISWVLLNAKPETLGTNDVGDFMRTLVTFAENFTVVEVAQAARAVLSGSVVLIVQGLSEAIVIDVRLAPARSVDEPQSDRVLRGPHDGFVESLMVNCALIRRRIRDTRLTMEQYIVGRESKSDVVLCYMQGKVNEKALKNLRKKLESVDVEALTMSQQSLMECLQPKQVFNPFPKARYSERPDCAAAAIQEGGIIILCENSPVSIVVPTGVFDFLQDTNDYYLSPFVGSYLRTVRLIVILLTVLLTPVWFWLVSNPEIIPDWLSFIKIEKPNTVPVFAQLLIVELVIDALKLASINTPSALSGSFSIVGALVLGEFAVQSGWFVSEVVLYMAFVAITDFAQPSVEFGYSLKLIRLLLLVLTRLLSFWGLLAGLAVAAVTVASTKTLADTSYLYPLIPFNAKALSNLLIRKPIKVNIKKESRP